MTEHTADVSGDLAIIHREHNQAITTMTELAFEPTTVLREQGRAFEVMQQRQQVVVLNPSGGDFFSNLSKGNSPPPQKHPLIVADVFVEQIHAAIWPFK